MASEADWIIRRADVVRYEGSLSRAGLLTRVFILFTDSGTGEQSEVSAEHGILEHGLWEKAFRPPDPMTASEAQAKADALVAATSQNLVQYFLTLRRDQPLEHRSGGERRAASEIALRESVTFEGAQLSANVPLYVVGITPQPETESVLINLGDENLRKRRDLEWELGG